MRDGLREKLACKRALRVYTEIVYSMSQPTWIQACVRAGFSFLERQKFARKSETVATRESSYRRAGHGLAIVHI